VAQPDGPHTERREGQRLWLPAKFAHIVFMTASVNDIWPNAAPLVINVTCSATAATMIFRFMLVLLRCSAALPPTTR
jgi:hypothetical protein